MKRDQTKILRKAGLSYDHTHAQFTAYLDKAANDVANNCAHIQFSNRASGYTSAVIRALVPGEEHRDRDDGIKWLAELSAQLKLGQDIGRLSLSPRGAFTVISVSK